MPIPFLAILLALIAVAAAPARAQVTDEAQLARALVNAKKNVPILVAAGEYDIADIQIRRNATLIGEGEVVFFSSRPVAKGLLNPVDTGSLHVENITFRGAVSPDLNGAGIRHDGEDLTVVNCRFIGNENGILSTGSDFGRIRIERSTFSGNGHGDGYSHGVYVLRAESVEVRESRFEGTKIGHHLKLLARRVLVVDSDFDDSTGRASYALDASKGGDVTFANNRVLKSADADNHTVINYDLTRGGKAKALRILNNRIVNRNPNARLLRNDTRLAPEIDGNEIVNEGRGRMVTGAAPAPAARPALREAAAPARAVAAGALVPEAGPPGKPEARGLLKPPALARPDDAVLIFRLANNAKTAEPARLITFGQAFAPGALKPGEPLAARAGAARLPVQIDVKALHADGSVRHAAITVATPPLGAGESLDVALAKGDPDETPGPFDAQAIVDSALDAEIALGFEPGGFASNMRAIARNAFSSPRAPLWLDGPLVKEARIEQPVAPHLMLRIDLRVYRDGVIRTSLAFSNEKTFSPGRRDIAYSVRIGDARAPAFSRARVAHHRSSVWRRVFWTGGQPRAHVVFDLGELVRSGAILPLDAQAGVAAAAIAALAAELSDEPLAPANLEKYFPTTGGRGEIGIYPQWTALYLIAQTEWARHVMLANAEAAGAAPWHFIDERTGAPVDIRSRRKFWSDERGLEEQYAPDRPHPDIFASDAGGWETDQDHKGALSFVPYLVTADRHYADALAMQAAYALFGRWPALREGGLKAIDIEQVRGTAWSLRDISDAAFILPDAHPLKDYFRRALKENLSLMRRKYVETRVMRGAGELEGYIEEYVDRDPERISPWQQDYVVIALWLAARRGEADARALLAWTEGFQTGRFLSGDFDPKRATSYAFKAKDGASQKPLSSWAEVARRTYGGAPAAKALEGYPDMGAGYVASARAALMALAAGAQSERAKAALARLDALAADAPLWSPDEDGGVFHHPQFRFRMSDAD